MPGDLPDPFVESRIDAALRSYAEPPASLSDPRTAAAAILERARQSQRRRSWWLWAVPAATAIAALAVVLLWIAHSPAPPKIIDYARVVPPPAVGNPHATTPATAYSPSRAKRASVRRPRLRAASLPQQAVFPTPAPLSRQEQALVVFTHVAPPAVRQAVINEQSNWTEDSRSIASSPLHPISDLDQDRP